jgi:hypothetical protein
MRYLITILSLFCSAILLGQSQIKRVLFLGNSYTAVNNLPQLITEVAASAGDTVNYYFNLPGGYTLQGHSVNTTSLSQIMIGNFDFVVLQEQSQLPSFPISQVETNVFPYAHLLDSLINFYNPCCETVFYMTWGRKNGDASNCATWPPVCTYSGMDSLLNLRYRMMADSNDAVLSPVGAVWHYIRQNFPLIELYAADESHPSVAGSYAAACCFYSVLFRKDPTLITFDASLPAAEAANIRLAAKQVVYDSLLTWHVGEYDPSANFLFSVSGANQITFTNNSLNSTSYLWNFGDGDTSTAANPVHDFPASGLYTVTLIASHCNVSDTTVQTINAVAAGIPSAGNQNLLLTVYPNPTQNNFVIDLPQQNFSVEISDATGRKVYSEKNISGRREIDCSGFESGIYFIRAVTEKNLFYRKMVVSR